MVGAERRQNTTQGAEGGKADQSDPAKGGGGGAVNRPDADPAAGRTPAKAGGRSDQAENKRTPAKAVDWSERPSKQILLGAKAESSYITLIILQG